MAVFSCSCTKRAKFHPLGKGWYLIYNHQMMKWLTRHSNSALTGDREYFKSLFRREARQSWREHQLCVWRTKGPNIRSSFIRRRKLAEVNLIRCWKLQQRQTSLQSSNANIQEEQEYSSWEFFRPRQRKEWSIHFLHWSIAEECAELQPADKSTYWDAVNGAIDQNLAETNKSALLDTAVAKSFSSYDI